MSWETTPLRRLTILAGGGGIPLAGESARQSCGVVSLLFPLPPTTPPPRRIHHYFVEVLMLLFVGGVNICFYLWCGTELISFEWMMVTGS